MNLVSFSLIIIGVSLNAAAQLLMKAGTNAVGYFEFTPANILPIGWKLATEWHIVTAVVFYVVSMAMWILALSRVQVSIAYPMLSLGYVMTALAAWWLFGEALNPIKIIGIGVIIFGVVLLFKA